MIELLDTLKERQKRTIQRKLKSGEIEYDGDKKCFVYSESKNEFDLGQGDKDSQGDKDNLDEENKSNDSDEDDAFGMDSDD